MWQNKMKLKWQTAFVLLPPGTLCKNNAFPFIEQSIKDKIVCHIVYVFSFVKRNIWAGVLHWELKIKISDSFDKNMFYPNDKLKYIPENYSNSLIPNIWHLEWRILEIFLIMILSDIIRFEIAFINSWI
jgi:hypothetical protein